MSFQTVQTLELAKRQCEISVNRNRKFKLALKPYTSVQLVETTVPYAVKHIQKKKHTSCVICFLVSSPL